MSDLLPAIDASLANWAIEHGGPWAVLGGGVLFVWFVFRRGIGDDFIDFSDSSEAGSCGSGTGACSADGSSCGDS